MNEIEALKAYIERLESSEKQKDELILSLQNSIKDLKHTIDNLTEIIRQMRKDKYGASSEKTVRTDGATDLKLIGTETVREELEYISAKLQVVRYVRKA